MADPETRARYIEEHRKRPNFGLVVLWAGAAFIVFFVIAWFVLHESGRHLLPPNHRHPPGHAYLQVPSGGRELV